MVPADSVAGNTLIGMFTRLIFRKPFHVARAVTGPPGNSELKTRKSELTRESGTLPAHSVQSRVSARTPGRYRLSAPFKRVMRSESAPEAFNFSLLNSHFS